MMDLDPNLEQLTIREKKGLEQEMKCRRVATYVLPIGILRIFFISRKSLVFYGEP
jgi:hypothetical protein